MIWLSSFKAFSSDLSKQPISVSEMLLALEFYKGAPKEIIVVVPEKSKLRGSEIVSLLRSSFIPNRVMAIVHEKEMLNDHSKIIPLMTDKVIFDNKPTAYVCTQGICRKPTSDVKELRDQIEKKIKL